MEIIYKAFDGKEFNNEKDCLNYERINGIKAIPMWNCDGNRVHETCKAKIVFLKDEASTEIFLNAAKASNDEDCCGIDEYDTGLFCWNESESRYTYFDRNDIEIITKAIQELDKEGL